MTSLPVRALPILNGKTAPQVKPIRWIIKQFLAHGAGTLMFGQPGVSKTVHAAHIAACLVAGVPFAQFETVNQGLRVLYLDFDSSWDWNGELFKAAFRGVGVEDIPEEFMYFSPQTEDCHYEGEDAPPLLALEALGPAITQTVIDHRIDVVICDSLGQMMVGDSNSGQDVSMALRLGLSQARRAGAAILVIDHATKGAVNAGGIPTPMGSQQKRAWARISVALEREEVFDEGVTRWTIDKSNSAPFKPFLTHAVFTSMGESLEQVELAYLGEAGPRPIDRERVERKAEGEQGILAALQNGPLRRAELQQQSGAHGGTFDRALSNLEKAGRIVRQERGIYALREETGDSTAHHIPKSAEVGRMRRLMERDPVPNEEVCTWE